MKPFINNIIYIFLLFSVTFSLVDTLNSISLYILLPTSFALCFLNNNTITTNIYVRLLIVMYIWCIACSIGAVYPELALREIRQILGVIVLTYTIASLAKYEKLIPRLYFLFIILFIAACIYAQTNILPELDISEGRLSDDKLNANALAYYTFYLTFSLFILGIITKNKSAILFKILFLAIIPISFYIAILTASRQVLVIQAPLIAILLYVRYLRRSKMILLYAVSMLVFLWAGYALWAKDLYDNSILKARNELNIEEDNRGILLREALEVGAQHPITGVGPGNFIYYSSLRTFSHCTFTELFANTGLPGAIIFIVILGIFMKRQWYRFKQTGDQIYLLFFIFGLFFILDNGFYVFYSGLWLMAFFVLVATHSETIYRNRQLMRKVYYEN